MTGVVFGGSLDGRRLDVRGTVLHNLVVEPDGRDYIEIYVWEIVGDDRFLILNEVKEGAM